MMYGIVTFLGAVLVVVVSRCSFASEIPCGLLIAKR